MGYDTSSSTEKVAFRFLQAPHHDLWMINMIGLDEINKITLLRTWFLLKNLLWFLLRYRECRLQGRLPCILLAPSIGQIRALRCEGRGQEGEEEDGEHGQANSWAPLWDWETPTLLRYPLRSVSSFLTSWMNSQTRLTLTCIFFLSLFFVHARRIQQRVLDLIGRRCCVVMMSLRPVLSHSLTILCPQLSSLHQRPDSRPAPHSPEPQPIHILFSEIIYLCQPKTKN